MNPSDLIALQDIDSALDAIANKKPRLAEVAARQQAAAEVERLAGLRSAAQQRIDAAQAVIDAAEHDAAAIATKRARLDAQLKTVIAPREAEALMSEIAGLDQQRSDLDDRELEALDEQSAADGARADAVAALPGAEGVLADATAALAAATALLDAEVATLQAQRASTVSALDATWLTRYDRLRQQFGGVAIARLQHSHCSGCHMDLSPVELDQVRSAPVDELAECPQCGRLMAR